MSLWEAMQPWIDHETGLVQAGDKGRDNLPLMSAYLCRELYIEADYASVTDLHERILEFIEMVEVSPGLYKKLSDSWDDVTEDNLTGLAFFFDWVAEDIINHWNKNFSFFTIRGPRRIRDCMGKFFGLKAYLQAATQGEPTRFQRLIFVLSVWFTVSSHREGIVRKVMRVGQKIMAIFGKKFNLPGGASDPLKLSLKVDRLKRWCPKSHKKFYENFDLDELYSDFFGANHPMTVYAKSRRTN